MNSLWPSQMQRPGKLTRTRITTNLTPRFAESSTCPQTQTGAERGAQLRSGLSIYERPPHRRRLVLSDFIFIFLGCTRRGPMSHTTHWHILAGCGNPSQMLQTKQRFVPITSRKTVTQHGLHLSLTNSRVSHRLGSSD